MDLCMEIKCESAVILKAETISIEDNNVSTEYNKNIKTDCEQGKTTENLFISLNGVNKKTSVTNGNLPKETDTTTQNIQISEVIDFDDSEFEVEPFHPMELESEEEIETDYYSTLKTSTQNREKPRKNSNGVAVFNKELKVALKDFLIDQQTGAKIRLNDFTIPLENNMSTLINWWQTKSTNSKYRRDKNSTSYNQTSNGNGVSCSKPKRRIHPRRNCPYCSRTFSKREPLVIHLWNKHPEIPNLVEKFNIKFLSCYICKYKSLNRSNFGTHMLTHGKFNDAKTFNCDKCDFKTTREYLLRRHYATKHTTDKPSFTCRFCNLVIHSIQALGDHLLRLHPDKFDKSLKILLSMTIKHCTVCDFRCVTTTKINRHMAAKHGDRSKLKSLKCYICNYECAVKNTLVKHMAVHLEKNFKCKYCKEGFGTQNALDSHLWKSHKNMKKEIELEIGSRLVSCPRCSYKTVNQTDLTSHIRIQHEKAGKKDRYKCRKCDFKTNLMRLLRSHRNGHSNTQQTCSLCKQTFNRKSLATHLLRDHRTDEGRKLLESMNVSVYKCDVCPEYETLERAHYYVHLHKKHNIGSYSTKSGKRRRTETTKWR